MALLPESVWSRGALQNRYIPKASHLSAQPTSARQERHSARTFCVTWRVAGSVLSASASVSGGQGLAGFCANTLASTRPGQGRRPLAHLRPLTPAELRYAAEHDKEEVSDGAAARPLLKLSRHISRGGRDLCPKFFKATPLTHTHTRLPTGACLFERQRRVSRPGRRSRETPWR